MSKNKKKFTLSLIKKKKIHSLKWKKKKRILRLEKILANDAQIKWRQINSRNRQLISWILSNFCVYLTRTKVGDRNETRTPIVSPERDPVFIFSLINRSHESKFGLAGFRRGKNLKILRPSSDSFCRGIEKFRENYFGKAFFEGRETHGKHVVQLFGVIRL